MTTSWDEHLRKMKMLAKARASKKPMQPVSIRMDPKMRFELEAAGLENGRTLSAEIIFRLRTSLEKRRTKR